MMVQLNLLPDLKKEFIKAQKTKGKVIAISVLVTLAAVVLSVALFAYVNFAQQFQINLISSDIAKKEEELKSVENIDKYLTIQNQLASIDQLHANKGAYSRLFTFLNTLNPGAPNNVTLNSAQLVADQKATVFEGTTTTFEALNIFVDTLKNAKVSYKANGQGDLVKEPMFTQVVVQSSGLARVNNKTVVGFTVKAIYTDPVFDARNTEVTVEVPNITTTPSVTNAPQPAKELFNNEGTQ